MLETVKLRGKLVIRMNGEIVREVDNLVVTTGKGFVASRMAGAADSVMSHMAVGTDNTAAALGQTALVTEIGRVALTSGVATGDEVEYVATFPSGVGTGSLTEAGIFNATPAGTMLCRTVFSAIAKSLYDAMTVTWTVTVG